MSVDDKPYVVDTQSWGAEVANDHPSTQVRVAGVFKGYWFCLDALEDPKDKAPAREYIRTLGGGVRFIIYLPATFTSGAILDPHQPFCSLLRNTLSQCSVLDRCTVQIVLIVQSKTIRLGEKLLYKQQLSVLSSWLEHI